MKKPLFLKFIIMVGITLFLMIPISMIDGLISERGHTRDQALISIANSTSHAQTLTGPILVVPYTKTVKVLRKSGEYGTGTYEETQQQGELVFLPKTLNAALDLQSEVRRRGIFDALLYHTNSTLKGAFIIPKHYGLQADSFNAYTFHKPFVAVGVTDPRGFESAVKLITDTVERTVKPGTRLEMLGQGVHAELPELNPLNTIHLSYEVRLRLMGTSRLEIAPLAEETHVHMQSDWPHPSFQGQYLPVEHHISDQGFEAHWRTTYFSTNMQSAFSLCFDKGQCQDFKQKILGVDFIDPTDQYVKSDRAIKYALMFIVLTFAGFFLFEVLKALRVHPVQYGLVGLALALFYLLLVSLSEHMVFGWAYFIAACACISLIGVYVVHTLGSALRAAGFTSALGLLYAMLYGLLQSEDYALLMGSCLLFGVLSLIMLSTRKLDWYTVMKQPAERQEATW